MKDNFAVFCGFTNSIADLIEFLQLKLIEKESNEAYKVYRYTYLDSSNKKIKLRLELDHIHKKLSYGNWDDHSLQTKKFKYFTNQQAG